MVKENKVLKIIIIIIIVLIVLALAGFGTYKFLLFPVAKNNTQLIDFEVNKGETPSTIAKKLKNNGLIKNDKAFKAYIRLKKVNNLKAGKYEFSKSMSTVDIINSLAKGPDANKNTINITFLEGKNMRWVVNKIASETNNTEEQIYNTLKDVNYLNEIINKYWFITDEIKNPSIYYSLEGYLFPDTYNFKDKDVKVKEVFNKMLDNMQEKLEPYKQEIMTKGYNVNQILTVASIVELEAKTLEEKQNVAAVIYNRIRNKMSLGSDVTTYYAVKKDMKDGDLYKSELNLSNPYNTRGPNMEGKLPVGPICMVGIDAINATLHPAATNYLYFVADKNSKLYFAKTIQEHNQIINQLKNNNLWFEYK